MPLALPADKKLTALASFAKRHIGKVLFLLSFLLFLVVQTYLIYAPIKARSSPIDSPAAYSYIVKAVQILDSCFLQDCPALLDLWPQFTEPATDLDAAYTRVVEYHRIFVVYHPLHSIIIAGLKMFGITYEKAYDLVAISGKILICFGAAYWVLVVYGRPAATIGLLMMTPIVFPGQGLHSIVSSNIALGISFILWALILSKNQKFHSALLPLLVLAMLMHQIGRIYGLVGVALYFTHTRPHPLTRNDKKFLFGGLGFIALAFLSPMFIDRPELSSITSSWYPVEWNYAKHLITSLTVPMQFITFWLTPVGGAIGAALLIALAVWRMSPSTRNGWLITATLLIGLIIFSAVYIDPWYGPLIFERTWVPVGIFLTGALGLGVWNLTRAIYILGKRFARNIRRRPHFSTNPRNVVYLIFAFSFFALSLIQGFTGYLPFYSRNYFSTVDHLTNRMNFRYDLSQPDLLMQNAESFPANDTIIYMDRVGMYFYLVHGGLNYGAFYYPALEPGEVEEEWLQIKLKNSTFLVSANPMFEIQNKPEMEVDLDDGAQLEFAGVEPLSIHTFQAFLIHDGLPVDLEIQWRAGGEIITTTKTILQNTSGWIGFSQDVFAAEQVTIRVIGNRSITVHGISLENRPTTNWPWDPGIILKLTPAAGDAISVELSEYNLVENLPINIDVLDDDGITILAKVVD